MLTYIKFNVWGSERNNPWFKPWFNILNSNFERMYSNSTSSITVTPEKYCAEQYLKAYGYIVEIYDFTQKNSLIRYQIPFIIIF